MEFRAAVEDPIEKTSSVSQITAVGISSDKEKSIKLVGYRVINGKIDLSTKLNLPELKSPINYYKIPAPNNLIRKPRASKDDRRIVNNTDSYPYKALSMVVGKPFLDERKKRLVITESTGSLIAGNLVLTAGHSIYDHERKKFEEGLEFLMVNGKTASVSEIWFDENMPNRATGEIELDLAIVVLDSNLSTRPLGILSHPNIEGLNDSKVKIMGFTEDKKSGTLWENDSSIEESNIGDFEIDTYVAKGTSGAPVLVKDGNHFFITGVVSMAVSNTSRTFVSRITPQKLKVIAQLINRS